MDLNGKNLIITLLREKQRSRVDLSHESGLGKSALTKVTKQLLDEGVIEECSSSLNLKMTNGSGRPKSLLQLVSGINFSICFYISIEGMKVFLVDLSGIVHQTSDDTWQDLEVTDTCLREEQLIDLITHKLNQLCLRQGVSPQSLKVMTIATQGKIAQNSGVIHYSQLLKSRGVELAKNLKDQTGIETKLFNIAYCSTFQLARLYPHHPNIAALLLGYGLGVGICVNEKIVTGPDGTALEISHMNYDKNGRECFCGSLGCAETYVTYKAIIDSIEEEKGTTLYGDTVVEKLKTISGLLDKSDEKTHKVIKEVSHVLGYILTQLISLFDVRTIFLNGETSILFPHLKKEIESYIDENNGSRISVSSIEFLREADDRIALDGLLELTNRAYQL